MTSEDIISFLYRTHVATLPREQQTGNRLILKLQELHWLYIDNFCKPPIKRLPFSTFVRQIGTMIGWAPTESVQLKLKEFWRYCRQLPRAGTVLVSTTPIMHILLVRNTGGTKWFFPIGKVHEGEDSFTAAQRETFEETGYRVPGHVGLIQTQRRKSCVNLYVVPNVLHAYEFRPRTRHEIAEIQWFSIEDCRKIIRAAVMDNIEQLLVRQSF